jgi:hypothetical protein
MSNKMGISTRIARELETLRRELALKNKTRLVDADREIVNVWRELKIKGTKIKREIIF